MFAFTRASHFRLTNYFRFSLEKCDFRLFFHMCLETHMKKTKTNENTLLKAESKLVCKPQVLAQPRSALSLGHVFQWEGKLTLTRRRVQGKPLRCPVQVKNLMFVSGKRNKTELADCRGESWQEPRKWAESATRVFHLGQHCLAVNKRAGHG